MRTPLIVLTGALAMSTYVGVVGAAPLARANRPGTSGCGTTTANDSAGFLEMFRGVVSSPVIGDHTQSGLPYLPADSVLYGGTSAQCDSVLARYHVLRTAETGVAWSSFPVIMLRVGSTHWVADPKVVDQHGQREWIILDSTLTIVKVWRTSAGR